MYERKTYERLLDWKRSAAGETALLVEGARRVGKTTLVKRFAESEYPASMVIDFAHTSVDVREYSDAGLKPRVSPIEVKSSTRYSTKSLEKFRGKFGKHVGTELVLHPKNLLAEGNRIYLPLYMAHLV